MSLSADAPIAPPPARRAGGGMLFWVVAALVLGLDRATKQAVLAWLPFGHPSVDVIPGVLQFTHVRNPGTAFGLLQGTGPMLGLLAVVAAVFIVGYWLRLQRQGRTRGPWLAVGLAMPLGGAIGNLIDRMVYGQVIDFIDFGWWPVFNVADIGITCGAAMAGYYFFRLHEEESRESSEVHGPGGAPAAEGETASGSLQTTAELGDPRP